MQGCSKQRVGLKWELIEESQANVKRKFW